MVMVNRKSIRLLTAWVLAAALLAVLGSDALARESRVWGQRSPSVGSTSTLATQAPSPSKQAGKPVVRPYSGEPDVPHGSPQTSMSGSQLSYWQQVLLGLITLLPGQRMP